MASATELVFNASLGGAVIDKPIYEKPFIYEDDTYNNFDLNMSVIYGNSSTNITELFVNPFFMPWWQKTLWLLLFGVMVFVATSGNLIVIWIVLTEKRMRTVTNIFLVNLSIADAMVSTLNVIFSIIYMISGHWPFGRIYCKISQFVSLLSVAASVFTLMAISIDSVQVMLR
ncbi:Tachykinin-like peptides receptor 99D [Armadillidium vulgare]|nr:Tachykinin-like peptides receptor 99D [Armadillidium vulgare]